MCGGGGGECGGVTPPTFLKLIGKTEFMPGKNKIGNHW